MLRRLSSLLTGILGVFWLGGLFPAPAFATTTKAAQKTPAAKTAPAPTPSPAGRSAVARGKTAARKPAPQHTSNSSATRSSAPAKRAAGSRASNSRRARSVPTSRSWKYSQRTPTPERYLEIERALFERGYLNKMPDGKWDQESVSALRRFQTDNQLAGDGKLTAMSLIALGLGPRRPTASTASLLAESQSDTGENKP